MSVVGKTYNACLYAVGALTSGFGKGGNARAQRLQNAKYDGAISGEFICSQRAEPFPRMRYSLAHLDGVGCEIIAVYNALLMLGRECLFSSLVCDFACSGMQLLFGFFGSNPLLIGRYFEKINILCRKYATPDELENALCDGDVFIMSFRNPDGLSLHTVALKSENGKALALNDGCKNGFREFSSPEKLLSDKNKFIVAYIVG